MSLPEAIQHVEEFLRDNLETESCNTQHKELLGFLKELQARRSTPLYTPVKPEDVKNGWYWLVGPDGEKMVDRVVWKYTVGGAEDVHVNDLAEAGFTFYRIPELPDDLEVSE